MYFIKIFIILFIVGYVSFDSYSQEKSNDSLSTLLKSSYKLIRDGLFKDSKGNVCFKTLNESDPKYPEDRFIYVVYSIENDGIKEMKDVIDPETFKSLGSDYYKDKHHIYYFYKMSDGGTMRMIDADIETFMVFKHSMYAIDKNVAFYRGNPLNKVDISTFEPIIIEGRNGKIGWYAKDENNYYNGADIMNGEEIEALKIKSLYNKN